MFKVDVFVSEGRAFDRQEVANVQLEFLDEDPGARRFPIASAEDTVLAKLEWFRKGGEQSERQWWDILGMLRVKDNIDREYLETWATSLGVSDLLHRAFVDAAL